MSNLKKLSLTPERLAANRRNARRSTGPRTPEGKARVAENSLKHGLYRSPQRKSLEALGESAKEFEALRRGLEEEWQPSTWTEGRLVKNLAGLLWRLERARRAQEGVTARRVELLEIERARRRSSTGRQVFEGSELDVRLKGLRKVEDSPGKFEEALIYLVGLLGQVERRDFSEYPEGILKVLYGHIPTWRGARIARVFRSVVKPAPARPPGGRPGEPAAAGDPAYAGPPVEASPAPPPEKTVAHLESLLREEIEQVQNEYELYKQEHVEISPALRDSCLAPFPQSATEWTLLIRQENSLLRHIDRTVKLLVALKRKRPGALGHSEGGDSEPEKSSRLTRRAGKKKKL